jgi:hypothetical protein
MPNMTINHLFIFTPAARARFQDVQLSFAAPSLPLPVLVPGDLVRFDAVGDVVFTVVGREFRFGSQEQLDVTYMLDLEPREMSQRTHLHVVDSSAKQGG